MQIARKVSIPDVGICRTVEKNDNSFQIHHMHKMGLEQHFKSINAPRAQSCMSDLAFLDPAL